MSDGYWRPVLTVGVVALFLIGGAIWAANNQPLIVTPPARPAIDLAQCGYEPARQAARDARQRRERASPRRSEAARARDDHRVEAAEKQQADARTCEERLHDTADLEAQWAAATAAANSANVSLSQWRWAYIEFAALVITLGAAAWAAWETGRAADVARLALEGIERPMPFPTPLSVTITKRAPDTLSLTHDVVLQFGLENFGRTPAIIRDIECRIGIGEPSDPFEHLPDSGAFGPIYGGFVLMPSQPSPRVVEIEHSIRLPDHFEVALRASQMLRFSGTILYDDAAGIRREYVFLWNWHPDRGFGPPDSDENFDRKTDRVATSESVGREVRAHRKKYRVGPYWRRHKPRNK